MLHVTGTGKLLVSSYGAIHELTLAAGQKMTIDTGHLVAFSEGIGFKVRTIGGVKSTLFSGEGLVVDLAGPGRILMQTRSTDAFLSWLIPRLPKNTSSSSRAEIRTKCKAGQFERSAGHLLDGARQPDLPARQ